MKDLKDKLFEAKQDALFSEVQNEIEEKAAYRTLNFSNGQKKYKNGFISFNQDGEFVAFVGFNTIEDYTELLGCEEGLFDDLEGAKIGEAIEIKDTDSSKSIYMKIW